MSFAVAGYNFAAVVHYHNGIVIAVIFRVLHRLVHAKDDPVPVLPGQLTHTGDKGAIQMLGSRQRYLTGRVV